MDFVPGALVAGRYRLKRMVGAGGMGEVWSGEDTKEGGRVAVKHLLPAAAKHHEVVARFKREAFLLGRVESEYVARVKDFFDDETFGLVLIMEFIDGPSLAHILEQRTLTIEESLDLAVDLLRALADLHNSKIVHRDLKPGNIIMRPVQGLQRATVVDFGISRLLTEKGENEVTGITRANIALGTVEYMAPEQILNSRDVTPVTDLYAVGIILYRSVKGYHAFGDRRGEELARAKLIEDAPLLETGRHDEIATGLTAMIAKALKKKPSQRYASATKMLEEAMQLQQLAMANLDDATTDSGDQTAVKVSPLGNSEERLDGRLPAHVSSGSPPKSPLPPPRPSAPPKVVIGSQAQHPLAGTAPLGSLPGQAQPAHSSPSPHQSSSSLSAVAGPAKAAAGNPSAPTPSSPRSPMRSVPEMGRGSLPSIPESSHPGLGSMPSTSVSADGHMTRGSLASIPDYGRNDAHASDGAVVSSPRAELTTERGGGLSRGTVALAILTAFAVGAAVGLIVAPSAPTPASNKCAPSSSVSAAVAVASAAGEPLPLQPTTAPPPDPLTASASASAGTSGSASSKPALTGKLQTTGTVAAKTSKPSSDGLGEKDPPPPRPPPPPKPPPPPTAPAPPTGVPLNEL